MEAIPTVNPGASRVAPALALEHVSKSFRLPHASGVLHALDDVSLSAARGEFLGIVGRNGSGKSTLLRCLAGIYSVDAGSISVEGRLSPFLELGVGFSPDLTARDNVMITGTMLGLSRREARERYEPILEFAELEEFAELPLKNYSSGMRVRLAFAISIQADADVLLFDEVLAVGDARFREKCFAEFERMKGTNTILLVTHSMAMVERFCDRAVLLEGGRVLAAGEPEEISSRYYEVNESHATPNLAAEGAPEPARRQLPPAEASHLPSAWEGDVRRVLGLAATLAATSIKLRFAGSRLGLAWSVLRPLMLFGILYAVFTEVVRYGNEIPHYQVYLLTSIILWTFFADATGSAVGSIVARVDLLRKMRFPRVAVPLSIVLVALFDLAVNLLVVVAFVLGSGIAPRAEWLEVVPLLAVLLALSTGVALLLAAAFVRRRDIGQLWAVVVRGLFYASAVLYPVSAFPDSVERAMMANPLVSLFTEARHALIDPSAPTAASAIGGAPLLAIPLALALGVLAVGLWVFTREAPRMAENI